MTANKCQVPPSSCHGMNQGVELPSQLCRLIWNTNTFRRRPKADKWMPYLSMSGLFALDEEELLFFCGR